MPFANDITGQNGKLIRQQMQSPNFVSGSAGWIIRKDGTVEFNNGTFRGSIAIGNSQELLIYSSALPAAGTLLISIAGKAGVDGFGNSFPQGIAISMGGSQMVLGETGGSPLIYFGTGRAAIANSSGIQTIIQGAGAGSYDQIQFLGAQDSTQLDAIDFAMTSSSADGTQPAQIMDFYHDPSGGFHFYRIVSYAGEVILAGAVTGVQPGTGTSRANPAVGETWHSPVPSALWTTAGTAQPVRFRYQPDGTVRLDGEIITTGVGPWPANATIFSVGAGYMPVASKPFITRSDIAVAAGQCTVNVLSSGSVQNGQTFTAAGQRLWFDGITFPTS